MAAAQRSPDGPSRPPARPPKAKASADSGMANVRMPQPSTASSTAASSTPHASATQSRIARLQRVPGAEVAVERPALEQAARQAERVLARAVVADPRRPRAARAARGSRGRSGPQPSAASWRPQARRISPTTARAPPPPPWEAQASARCRSPSAKRSSTPARTLPSACSGLEAERANTGRAASGPVAAPSGSTAHQAIRCSLSRAPPRRATTRIRSAPPAGRRASGVVSPSGSRPSRPT